MIPINEYVDTLISAKRYEIIVNENDEKIEKILIKKSIFSVNNIQVEYMYYESNNNIDKYDEIVKLSFNDFKKSVSKSLTQFAKNIIKPIELEILSGKNKKGYEVPSVQDINSKLRINSISVYINKSENTQYICTIQAKQIPSGSHNINISGKLKFNYNDTGEKIKTQDPNNISGFNISYK